MNAFLSLRLRLPLSRISSFPSSQSVRAFCVQIYKTRPKRGKPIGRLAVEPELPRTRFEVRLHPGA